MSTVENKATSPSSTGRAAVPIGVKLSLGIALVTIIGVMIAGTLAMRAVETSTRDAFEDRLGYEATMLGQMTANALFGDLDPNDTSLAGPVRSLGEAVHTELAVIAQDGTVVAESATDDPHSLGNQAQTAEIARAKATGKGTAVHDGRMYVARAIVRDGATLGFARSSVPMSEVTAAGKVVRKQVLLGTALATILATIVGIVMASRLVRPIRELAAGAKRVGAGDFAHEIPVGARDEIGVLAETFNDMTRSLKRTIDSLDQRNADMRMVMDHVDQGLCTLSPQGTLSLERSQIMDSWFGPSDDTAHFWDVIRPFDPHAAAALQVHWTELEAGDLPLDLLVHQLPSRLRQGERLLDVSYRPIMEDDGETLSKMLIVVSDVTARIAAENAEAEQRELAAVFERIMKDKAGVIEFFVDAEAQVAALTVATERAPLPEIRRRIHTLKGNSAIFGMMSLSAHCHEIESHMAEENLDMSVSDQNNLKDRWKRLSSRFASFLGEGGKEGIVIENDEYATVLRALLEGVPRAQVAKLVQEWKNERVSVRLERLGDTVRQAGATLEKKVDAIIVSSALRVPREEWAPFWGSLVHTVRNAVDHGIEPSDARVASGKTETGRITLSAQREGTWGVIRVADDGGGINFEKIRERAREAGLPHSTREDLVDALFADGVTSKDEVAELSGRGVGLAATKQECEQLGGFVVVNTTSGLGTTFEFHIPLPEAAPIVISRDSMKPRGLVGA